MAPPLSISARLARLARQDAATRALLIEAALCLAVARIALVCAPFPFLARRLGAFVSPQDAVRRAPAPLDAAREAALATRIGCAVRSAARHLPFETRCLAQAIAARVMLKRRGVASVLHFGVAKGATKAFDAHAWLDAAGVEVAGYPVTSFSEIACFV